jgi:glycerol uptake facilitator protein
LLSEFLGTFVLVALGDGSVAMTVAALNQSGRGTKIFDAAGDWLLISWGWGFAVVFGVYVAGGVSGAHLNPAVTLAFALRRGFSWKKVPGYMAAQLVGAFVAGALIYANYSDSIASFEAAHNIVRGTQDSIPTYSIFATFPAQYFSGPGGPFVDQVIGTAFLVGLIFALVDERNSPPGANIAPFMIGMVVTVIGMTFGANAGYAINPARDLGPRLWAWIEGWGEIAVPGNYGNVNSYMWVPIVGPLVGAVVGGVIYDWFIRDILRARGEKKQADVEERGRTVQQKEGEGETA